MDQKCGVVEFSRVFKRARDEGVRDPCIPLAILSITRNRYGKS
jgi:hypothetical protein